MSEPNFHIVSRTLHFAIVSIPAPSPIMTAKAGASEIEKTFSRLSAPPISFEYVVAMSEQLFEYGLQVCSQVPTAGLVFLCLVRPGKSDYKRLLLEAQEDGS